jgi:hypothetical protein
MKARLVFFFLYFIFWLVMFVLGKVSFLFYQYNQSFLLAFSEWIRIIVHGFMLDVSAAGYFSVVPLLILTLSSYSDYRIPYHFINGYTLLLLFVFLIITLVDFEIYKYWGVRLDITAFRFIGKPREMLASSSWWLIAIMLLALIVFTGLLFRLYRRYVAISLLQSQKPLLERNDRPSVALSFCSRHPAAPALLPINTHTSILNLFPITQQIM